MKVDPKAVRRTILGMLHRARASHLGSSMSVVESLIAMYQNVDVAKILSQDPARSRVIVSKGHCASAVYGTMRHFGLISEAEIGKYHTNESMLQGHVSHGVPFVEHSTGALGHGLSVAVGVAIGLRSKGHLDSKVLCLVGDGEIQEGSIWEALMYAHHHKLSNLSIIVDNNRISSITDTNRVIDLGRVSDRFAGFGVQTFEVDGHDVDAIDAAIKAGFSGATVSVIVANTVKGKGVPFAEGQPIWHYRSLSDADYETALEALQGGGVA